MLDHMTQNTGQYDILIVDDTPESLAFISQILDERGYRVRPVIDGRHALDSVAARLPDLILLDVEMPEMDGYKVCRRLKSDERSRTVPVIFISAHGETAQKVEGFKAGGVDYITKPFESEEVLARVEIQLRLRELTERLEQQVEKRTRQLRQEISEHKRTEEVLQGKDFIIESASSGIATCDLEGAMTYVNPAFLKTWGFEADHEIYGRPFWEFWMVKDRLDEIMTTLSSEKIWSDEIEARKKDGTLFHVHVLAAPVLNKKGEPVGLMSTSADITKRKQSEALINLRWELMEYAATHEIEDLYKKALDEAETLTQSEISFLHFVNPDQKTLMLQAWSTRTLTQFCTAKGKGEHYTLDQAGVWVDCVHQRRPVIHNDYESLPHKKGMPEGHASVIRELVVPIFRDDKIVAIFGIGNKGSDYTEDDVQTTTYCADVVWEIVERKHAEEELRKYQEHLEELVNERTAELSLAKAEAEAANAAKSEFLARMSHEIRTPLNAVTGLTNIVLKSELTAEQREYLNKVQLASDNLLHVINDILDFSKVEAGRLELANDPFNLDQVMEQMADLFSNRVARKDLELVFAVGPNVVRQLKGDAPRLIQILTNLVENAVKFTDSGEVVVSVEQDDRSPKLQGLTVLKFSVTDTGIGIGADVLPTLFEPFTQADNYLTRKHEGTGLGLAICRRLVKLMGGRIWAESTPGRGSTFTFTARLKTGKGVRPTLNLPVDLHGLKTLVVDDSVTARQVLVDLLESLTFNVAAVDSGEKAIGAIRRAAADKPFQLVLLDWKMPGMDGIETARRIYAMGLDEQGAMSREFRTPIIILVTAYGFELVQARLDMSVVDSLLLKPVKPSRLCDTIMELFGRAEVEDRRPHEPIAQAVHRLAGRRVLVVEDSELNRDVALALLEEADLTVEIAENGQVAVNKVTESPKEYYDAVLMDIQMPVMDGYEATREIREFEKRQDETSVQPEARTPVIALTAHALKGEKEKCLAAGMDDYLAKPLDEQELHRVLLKWITSR